MSSSFQKTLDVLAKTRNEAAVVMLLPFLDSPDESIRTGVFETLLHRNSQTGHLEIIRRLQDIPPAWRRIVENHYGRMTQALRTAILGKDTSLCQNACNAVLWFREYDLVPALVNAAEDRNSPNAAAASATVLRLAEMLSVELSGNRDYKDKRDPHRIKYKVLPCLAKSLERYSKHQQLELVESFLLLANRDDKALSETLASPNSPGHRCAVQSLKSSPLDAIIRLLLSFLEAPRAPDATMAVLSHRTDERFITLLLQYLCTEPSPFAKQHLKRMDHIAWLATRTDILSEIDVEVLPGIFYLLSACGVPSETKLNVLEQLLYHSNDKIRTLACEAIEPFRGKRANDLVLSLLEDTSPSVQAAVLKQLRPRSIPGSISRLIESLDSPNEAVQEAARLSLDEFLFDRFMASFDTLDEKVRVMTGSLVRKVDPNSVKRLREELNSPLPTRKRRALEMASVMNLIDQVETLVQKILEYDTDHHIRLLAIDTFIESRSSNAEAALKNALHDSSAAVQAAAENGLKILGTAPTP